MYTVRNLRPEPTVAEWLVTNVHMLCGLVLWAVVMLTSVAVSDMNEGSFLASFFAENEPAAGELAAALDDLHGTWPTP